MKIVEAFNISLPSLYFYIATFQSLSLPYPCEFKNSKSSSLLLQKRVQRGKKAPYFSRGDELPLCIDNNTFSPLGS